MIKMDIKLVKGLLSSNPTKLGRINLSFFGEDGDYLGSVDGQTIANALKDLGFEVLEKKGTMITSQHKPGETVWYFDTTINKIKQGELLAISSYFNSEVMWEVSNPIIYSMHFDNDVISNTVVADSDCFKYKEDLIVHLTA